jgi:transcriptional regulator with XRE-family HTH domain
MNYGKAIRVVRAAYGLSQAELARRLTIGPSQLSLIESGARKPSVRVLEEMSSVLKIPMDLLTALASESKDLARPEQQGYMNELGRALLQLLVAANDEQPELPMK